VRSANGQSSPATRKRRENILVHVLKTADDKPFYTGLCRGDAVRFERQPVRDGIGTIKTKKRIHRHHYLADPAGFGRDVGCGFLRPPDLPCVGAQPAAYEAIVRQSFPRRMPRAWRSRVRAGVRKIATTRVANSRATVAQLEAIFGWSSGLIGSLHTRAANRKRLATEDMHMLANEKRKSIPSP